MAMNELPERPLAQAGGLGPPWIDVPGWGDEGGEGPRVSPYAEAVIMNFVASIEGEAGGDAPNYLRSEYRAAVEQSIPAVLSEIVELYGVMERAEFTGVITAPDVFHWIADTRGEALSFGCPFPKQG
jgi:hypothetical protein